MGELLKNQIGQDFLLTLALEIETADSRFQKKKFLKDVLSEDWEDLELKARVRRLSERLGKYLPGSFQDQVSILKKVAPQLTGLGKMFLPDFVEVHGFAPVHENFSIDALKYFTEYFSSEFALRPFLRRDPKKILKILLSWTDNPNHHVRRLCSEATRPRLPWSFALTAFCENPQLTFPLLNKLKNDESLYVRKSVANHLNDISKDHPHYALEIAKSWKGNHPNTDWILKHGLRTLLKQGHPQALKIFQLHQVKGLAASRFILSKNSVKIGKDFSFQIQLENSHKLPLDLRLEYILHFQKKAGKTSPKVFQWVSKTIKPGSHIFSKKHSFQQRTTRKHYPGKHKIEVRLNGQVMASQAFHLKV